MRYCKILQKDRFALVAQGFLLAFLTFKRGAMNRAKI